MFSHPDATTHHFDARTLRGLFRLLDRVGARGPALRLARRLTWFTHRLTFRKLANLLCAAIEFGLRRERLWAWPVFLRIDISPLCNLRCTVCVHAEPHGVPALEQQRFHAGQRMSIDQFRRIIDEIKPWSTGVSLYYLGDPLVHPDLDELCALAHRAGLNVHYSTNFSFVLSDRRIRSIVTCGVTHLTVCVDGLHQDTYSRTRVGGRIDLVLANLARVCEQRRALRRRRPLVEVQYIKYQHNLAELPEALERFRAMGVDQVHELWGGLHNYTDRDPGNYAVYGPKRRGALPRCHWPYFFMQLKYNGEALPCCCHRLGPQYAAEPDTRCVGRVFETSVRAVWNSAEYRRTRRLVCNPPASATDPLLRRNFCADCPRLFETDYAVAACRWGKDRAFEELYAFDPTGRPVRRARPPAGALAAPADRTTSGPADAT